MKNLIFGVVAMWASWSIWAQTTPTDGALQTRPGTLKGTTPSQPPTPVEGIATGQFESEQGTIGGAIPTQNPTPVTMISPGVAPRPFTGPNATIRKGDQTVELQLVAQGLTAPLGVHAPDDGSGRLFVHDQVGVVWVLNPTNGTNNILLDVRDRLVPLLPGYDERGLIGFAVHPNFTTNRLVYTFTTEPVSGAADFTLTKPAAQQFDHQNVIAEWRIDAADSNRVDVASRREILRIDQPQSNHNGGTMRFGLDGFLYFGLGDGGGADDQDGQPYLGQVTWGHGATGNGQNIETLHGSLLRIDVHGTNSLNGKYGIPATNPFVGRPGLDEIYAYGLRNPYSFSFDRGSGEIYLGDAGQASLEEVNLIVAGGNYGWNSKEGSYFFELNGTAEGYVTNRSSRPVPANLRNPIAEFDHSEGRVVIGGFVYRGTNVPGLTGKYLASDFIMQNEPYTRLLYVDLSETNLISTRAFQEIRIGLEDRRSEILVRGFGEDAQGELYVVGSNEVGPMGQSGRVYKIVAPPPPITILTNQPSTSTNLTLAWSGGLGPFGVHYKLEMTNLFWNLLQVTANRQAVLPAELPDGILGVSEKPHVAMTAFTARLSGTNQQPTAINTPATGLGLFLLEGDELSYLVLYSNLTSTATAAGLFGPATPDETASLVLHMEPFGGALGISGMLAGRTVLSDEQRMALLNGQFYANVTTETNTLGEIRGQLIPATLASQLRGAFERPVPVNTPAVGNALLALVGDRLTFILNYQGLSTPAVSAHIHGPAGPDEVAPPIVDLTPYLIGSGTNGTVTGTVTLTDQQLAWVASGKTYLNVHSQALPAGEIRGQLYIVPGVMPMTVFLSGQHERPTPVNTPAGGSGLLAVSRDWVMYEMTYSNLTSSVTAAHIHGPASAEESAPPVIPLTPVPTSATNGFLSGLIVVPELALVELLNQRTYVNIHSQTNAAGEIRSQIAPVLYKTSLSGAAQRPNPVTTPATGAALSILLGNQWHLFAAFAELGGVPTGAFAQGPAGVNGVGDALLPLNAVPASTNGVIHNVLTLTPAQWNQVTSGRTYLNVTTPSFPAGEIRGQVLP